MSIRWNELCAYCPSEFYCESNWGDTCDYENWQEARDSIMGDIAGLREDDGDSDGN